MGGLRPGDIIRLKIWREPDLSGDMIVDERGLVMFPMIGRRPVAGLSVDALRDSLVSSYRQNLNNPSIDVTFLRRISVLGAVKAPGLYPVDATMRISDVLALAGGATPLGEPNSVDLIRDGKTVTTKLTEATRITDLGLQSGDQIFVPERSWVSRNSGVVAAGITAAVSIFIALLKH